MDDQTRENAPMHLRVYREDLLNDHCGSDSLWTGPNWTYEFYARRMACAALFIAEGKQQIKA